MRCYEDELMFDRITIYPEYSVILKSKLIEYNTIFNVYSDSYYLLNDPISVLDSNEFRNKIIEKYIIAKDMLSMLLIELHMIFLKENQDVK